MKNITFFISIFLLLYTSSIQSQDQSILIFDPNDVSSSFQSTLSQLTDDTVFIADTLDDAIFNYDAIFLFINYPYLISEEESNRLVQYTNEGNPAYVYCNILYQPPFDSTSFWHHIGIDDIQGLLIAVQVDSVTGIDTTFTSGVFIDTSFISWSVPVVTGNIDPILTAWWSGSDFNTTYISGYDSLNVIIDLYNLIDNYEFLRRVLEQFELIPPNDVKDQFNLVADFILFQNYPNPFNPSTKIKFTIPVTLSEVEGSLITLKVYDVLGNEIATLVNEEKHPGTYEVEFDGTNLTSGIYFYQLKAGSFIETKKMVLIK